MSVTRCIAWRFCLSPATSIFACWMLETFEGGVLAAANLHVVPTWIFQCWDGDGLMTSMLLFATFPARQLLLLRRATVIAAFFLDVDVGDQL